MSNEALAADLAHVIRREDDASELARALVPVLAGISAVTLPLTKATSTEVTTGTNDTHFATPKAIKDAGIVLTPVKATGAEIDTGTDDAKFATPKAIADSSLAFVADIPVKASGTEVTTGTDDAKFTTAKAIKDAGIVATPVKASGAEIDTGTDDAKFATAKAIKDAGIVATPVKCTGAEIITGTDDAKFATAKALAEALINLSGRAAAFTDYAGTGAAALTMGATVASGKTILKQGTQTNTSVLVGPSGTYGFGFGSNKDIPAVLSGTTPLIDFQNGGITLMDQANIFQPQTSHNNIIGTSSKRWKYGCIDQIYNGRSAANYDVDSSSNGDGSQYLYWDYTTGASTRTFTLPSSPTAGMAFTFTKIDNGAGALVIDAGVGKLINGSGLSQRTYTSTVQWATLKVWSNGTTWYVEQRSASVSGVADWT